MNEHRQNEEIALYCGWKFDKNQYKQWISPDETTWNYPPAYNKDLNQMHEAEKSLDVTNGGPVSSDCLRYAYSSILYKLVPVWVQPFRATAAQRAEAFLKTVGKWEE